MEDSALLTAKYIFVLYVMVSGNFLANLFSCRAQDALNNSMALKHVLGYMTMLFAVVLVDGKMGMGPHYQIFMTAALYLLFVVTTRMEFKYWVIFIVLLCANYILDVYQQHDQTTEPVKQQLRKIQHALLYGAVFVMGLGLLVYVGRKRLEYGTSFDPSTFLFGKTTCTLTKNAGTFTQDLGVLRRQVGF